MSVGERRIMKTGQRLAEYNETWPGFFAPPCILLLLAGFVVTGPPTHSVGGSIVLLSGVCRRL